MRHQIFDVTPVWSQEAIDNELASQLNGMLENSKGKIYILFAFFIFYWILSKKWRSLKCQKNVEIDILPKR